MHRTAPAAIERLFFGGLAQLAEPDDVLAGRVLFEQTELLAAVQSVCSCFIVEDRTRPTLPAVVLRPWLPLLLQLYDRIQSHDCVSSTAVRHLLVHCLANMERPALGAELHRLLGGRWAAHDDRVLHKRVAVIVDPVTERITVRIATADDAAAAAAAAGEFQPDQALATVLRRSEHKQLCYDVFMQLLGMLCIIDELRPATDGIDALLVHDADELAAVAASRIARRVAVLNLLMQLIEYRPWQALLKERPAEGIQVRGMCTAPG